MIHLIPVIIGSAAVAESPSIISGRVVATMIFSSMTINHINIKYRFVWGPAEPELSIGYANDVMTSNSTFSLES